MGFTNMPRRIATHILVVISAVLLFTAAVSASLNADIFSSSFHKSLFKKYGIYSHLEKTAAKTLQKSIGILDSSNPENDKQKEQLISLANKAVTPEMIKLNTDALIEGLMKYFSGEAQFLPDIYLKPVQKNAAGISHEAVRPASPPSEQPLAGIDRISLNVILMYMDRNDIVNAFADIRLIRFALSYAPVFLLLVSALLLVFAASAAGKRKTGAVFIRAALFAGIFTAIAVCFTSGLSRFYLPGFLGSSPLSGFLGKDALIAYAQSCIGRPTAVLAVCGAVFFTAALLIRLLPRHLMKKPFKIPESWIPPSAKSFISPLKVFITRHGRMCLAAVLALLLTGALLGRAQAMSDDFHSKDLGAALERLKGSDTYSRVTSARNEIIYSVEVRITDKQTDAPIQGVKMKLEGVLSGNKTAYSENAASDEYGKSRFNASVGSFRLEFDQGQFPEGYKFPASYPFEIKSAGMTIITVRLEKTEGKKAGIAEILVFGSDDKPLENLELSAEAFPIDGTADPVPTGKTFSFTNHDGAAIFKLTEGRYKVSLVESTLPQQYLAPEPMVLDISGDATAKYSLKLSLKAPQPKPAKKTKQK